MATSLHNDPRFEHLYEHNAAFRELSKQHQDIQKEADKLNKALYLSPDLDMRIHELKKMKLEIKDKLGAMLESVNP